ncbi:MAG: sulfite exporter TauE/SafE family protein [Gaiellaceae bacterium]
MTWELSLTGLLIGLLVGMTGMGGGSLMTPVLVLVFDFNVVVAVGTDILHGAIFKTIGAWRHRVLGHVHARLACWLALGSVPASLAGVWVIELLEDRYGDDVNDIASRILGAALVLGGLGFLIKTFVHRREADNRPYRLRNRDRVLAFVIGLFGGFILGLTSVGSGTFFGLMLLLLFPLTAPKIVGTDIAHAAILLWAAGLAHLSADNVDLAATGWLALGSIPGILLGSQWTVRLPERTIRLALGLVLLLAGLRLALG